jgi:hypothetical protein
MAPREHPDLVPGENLGIEFPTSLEVIQQRGPAFLTRAFQATGALTADNAVAEIIRFEEFIGGGAGRKAWLTVRYRHDEPGLLQELFAKMPRDFADPSRGAVQPPDAA